MNDKMAAASVSARRTFVMVHSSRKRPRQSCRRRSSSDDFKAESIAFIKLQHDINGDDEDNDHGSTVNNESCDSPPEYRVNEQNTAKSTTIHEEGIKNQTNFRQCDRICHRRRCRRRTSSRLIRSCVATTMMVMFQSVGAQFTNFEPSSVSCPADTSISGYTSVTSINQDIERELDRIEGGGDPQESYLVTLCPETTFDTSSSGPLLPTLDKTTISCGPDGDAGNNCVFSGGPTNILIADPTIDGYTINTLSFVGLTFTGFTGWSIDVTVPSSDASSTAMFMNCLWQDFTSTTGGIARANNDNSAPMSLVLDTSRIQVRFWTQGRKKSACSMSCTDGCFTA